MAEPLILDVAAGVARLTLNRPDQGNALNAELGAALRAAASEIEARDDVRVVVLAAAGKSFCVKATREALSCWRAGMVSSVAGRSFHRGAARVNCGSRSKPPRRPSPLQVSARHAVTVPDGLIIVWRVPRL